MDDARLTSAGGTRLVETAAPGGLVDQLFLAHPRTVGESYVEHAGIASHFGAAMMIGGVKCLAHALLPAVFERAASDCVAKLHGELERRRDASAESYPDYVI